jgi:hypothetical protein
MMDYEEKQEEQAEPQATEEVVEDTPYLSLRGAREEQAYALRKDRVFIHTWDFDPALMEKTGMNLEFASIWLALGWEELALVTELGSRPLTIHFLCSLTEIPDGIEFHLFGIDYRVSWKELSRLLSFNPHCAVFLRRLVRVFFTLSGQTSLVLFTVENLCLDEMILCIPLSVCGTSGSPLLSSRERMFGLCAAMS